MITSTSNTRIRQLMQWNQKAKARREDKVFIVEGTKMFLEAPQSWIREVYLAESFYEKMPEAAAGKLDRCSYEVVKDSIFQKISDTQTPQGILSVLKQPEYVLSDLGLMRQSGHPLVIVIENIQDPGNLGTIIRTAEAAGATGVVMSPDTVDVYNPKTIRATMGSIYRVPFLYVDSLSDAIRHLKETD